MKKKLKIDRLTDLEKIKPGGWRRQEKWSFEGIRSNWWFSTDVRQLKHRDINAVRFRRRRRIWPGWSFTEWHWSIIALLIVTIFWNVNASLSIWFHKPWTVSDAMVALHIAPNVEQRVVLFFQQSQATMIPCSLPKHNLAHIRRVLDQHTSKLAKHLVALTKTLDRRAWKSMKKFMLRYIFRSGAGKNLDHFALKFCRTMVGQVAQEQRRFRAKVAAGRGAIEWDKHKPWAEKEWTRFGRDQSRQTFEGLEMFGRMNPIPSSLWSKWVRLATSNHFDLRPVHFLVSIKN